MIDIEKIKKNYQKYDDKQILKIAEESAGDLIDDVIPILINEIEKRNLDSNLINWIHFKRENLLNKELESLKNEVKKCICNICKNNTKLKGFEFVTRTGLLILHEEVYFKIIVCENCGRRKRRNSAIWTAIFGWWSFPYFLYMPFVLCSKFMTFINEKKLSEQIIEKFIIKNLDMITIAKDKPKAIEKLLRYHNENNGEVIALEYSEWEKVCANYQENNYKNDLNDLNNFLDIENNLD